jgi:hypothetical protein
VDPEARVDVLDMLADCVRGDSEELCDLVVRPAFGHKLEDLGLTVCQRIRKRSWRSGAAKLGSSMKSLEVRQHDVQSVSIVFSKAPVRPIELEPGSSRRSVGTDPEPDHVLDAQRAADIVVELETVELSRGQIVRVHLRAA